jgi:hypothetical protein
MVEYAYGKEKLPWRQILVPKSTYEWWRIGNFYIENSQHTLGELLYGTEVQWGKDLPSLKFKLATTEEIYRLIRLIWTIGASAADDIS